MAKWKNALLISTIVAPIAFGASPLGDALAQARPGSDGVTPYTAVDVHKMLKTTSGDPATDPQNIYWGDGTTASADAYFTSDKGWSAAQNAANKYKFAAYRLDLGNKVITGYQPAKLDSGATNPDAGMPIFNTDVDEGLTINGTKYSWSQLLTAEVVPTAGVNQDNRGDSKKGTVSEYTINLNLGSVDEDDFQTALKAAEKTYVDADAKRQLSDYQVEDVPTSAGGVASFTGLHNGQWVVFETSSPDYVEAGSEAVPMVLNLPMQQAAEANSKNGWFGQTDKLNLYAKNYTKKGDLTVEKLDSKTGQGVSGAWIGLFTDKVDATLAADISTAVKDLKQGSDDADVFIGKIEAKIQTALPEDADLTDYLVAIQMTGSNGTTKFNDLEPGTTYGVLELVEPTDYVINPSLKTVTLSAADAVKSTDANPNGATDTDANTDGMVYYTGGQYEFGNFTPKVDKSIQLTGQDPDTWTGQGEEGDPTKNNVIDPTNDDQQGVDRGEDFKWQIQSDLPEDGTTFTTYKLTDTLPYQTNWYSAEVDVAGVDLVNVSHNNPKNKGGLTGHGITYDNYADDDDVATETTGINDGVAVDTPMTDGTKLKDGVTMTPVSGVYNALKTALGGTDADVQKYTDSTVDDDDSFSAWLNKNMQISGRSSYYTFDGQNRVVENHLDGQLVIQPNESAQKLFSALAAKTTTASERTLNVILDARANSAAQASIINNEVKFDVANQYDSESDKDNVKTFDAGWEIVKTTADGKTKLAGAGFDLAVQIDDGDKQEALLNNLYTADVPGSTTDAKIYDDDASDNVKAIWLQMFEEAAKSEQFEGYTYNGKPVASLDAADMQAAAYQTGDIDGTTNLRAMLVSMTESGAYEENGQNTLFFMHKDATTGEPMAEMQFNASGSTDIMGDVIWTPVQAWATTHYTGTDGYLQYCGLASGTYALIEVKAPEGYSMISSTVHLGSKDGGMDLKHAQQFELGVPGTTLSDNTTPASGVINGQADTEEGPNQDMIVKNYEKSIFPLVGGLGTLFAVIAGLLAMGLALLKRKKDMKNEV
jgi:hypothetical protein